MTTRAHERVPYFVLGGISRETVIDLAGEAGIPVVAQDLKRLDA